MIIKIQQFTISASITVKIIQLILKLVATNIGKCLKLVATNIGKCLKLVATNISKS